MAASAAATTVAAGANGSFDGTGVVGLRALGKTATRGRLALGDWGYLTLQSTGVDTTAPPTGAGYRGFVTAVDVHLTAPHGGLPAGSEIQLGHAEVDVQHSGTAFDVLERHCHTRDDRELVKHFVAESVRRRWFFMDCVYLHYEKGELN